MMVDRSVVFRKSSMKSSDKSSSNKSEKKNPFVALIKKSSPEVSTEVTSPNQKDSRDPTLDKQFLPKEKGTIHPTSEQTTKTIAFENEDKKRAIRQENEPSNTKTKALFDKFFLYKNQRKQKLGISDYDDQISARDLCFSFSGLASVIAAHSLQSIFLAGMGTLIPFSTLIFASILMAKTGLDFHKTAKDIEREKEAQNRIAKLLKETYLEKGGELYSVLDENPLCILNPTGLRQEYLNIALFLPSGKWFAISVKSLKGEWDYVYPELETNILRYRNRHGAKRWNIEPIKELTQQVEYLANFSDFFKTLPTKIVVISSPARVKNFNDVSKRIMGLRVLCLNGVYVTEEKDLLRLIDGLILKENKVSMRPLRP